MHRTEHKFLTNPHLHLPGHRHQVNVHVRMRMLRGFGVRREDPKLNLEWRLPVENQAGVITNAGDTVVDRRKQTAFPMAHEPSEKGGQRFKRFVHHTSPSNDDYTVAAHRGGRIWRGLIAASAAAIARGRLGCGRRHIRIQPGAETHAVPCVTPVCNSGLTQDGASKIAVSSRTINVASDSCAACSLVAVSAFASAGCKRAESCVATVPSVATGRGSAASTNAVGNNGRWGDRHLFRNISAAAAACGRDATTTTTTTTDQLHIQKIDSDRHSKIPSASDDHLDAVSDRRICWGNDLKIRSVENQ